MSSVAPAQSNTLRGRNILEVTDFSPGELAALISLARYLKAVPRTEVRTLLRGRTLMLLFEKPSLRTRVSFEVAMQQLGGETLFAAGNEFMIGSRETPEDAARVLSRYVDAIVVRTHEHAPLGSVCAFVNRASDQRPFGRRASVSGVGRRADHRRTLRHARGVDIAYVGDGKNNVAMSLAQAAVMLGAVVHFGSPPTHRPAEATLSLLNKLGEPSGGSARAFTNPIRAVRGADVIYTDVWTSMGEERYRERNDAMLRPYAVTEELFSYAQPHAIFMHCLPAHRGEEVSEAVIDGMRSAVLDEAENRLHAQKALLVALLTDAKGMF